MTNHIHQDDLPADIDLGVVVAIDTETMGLNPHRDRLCLVQLSGGDGDAHLVKIAKPQMPSPNLEKFYLQLFGLLHMLLQNWNQYP